MLYEFSWNVLMWHRRQTNNMSGSIVPCNTLTVCIMKSYYKRCITCCLCLVIVSHTNFRLFTYYWWAENVDILPTNWIWINYLFCLQNGNEWIIESFLENLIQILMDYELHSVEIEIMFQNYYGTWTNSLLFHVIHNLNS